TTASRRPQPRKSAAPDPVQSWTRRWFGVSGGGRAVTVPFNLQRRLHQQETTYAVSLPIVASRSREKGPGGTALRHPCRQRWHSISESAKDRKKEIARHSVDGRDRKSTRLNSSHVKISYAVFCLKKKTKHQ